MAAAADNNTETSETPKAPTGPAGLNSWDPSAQQINSAKWIEPAVQNKNPVRIAAILIATGLAARSSLLVPGALPNFIHLLSFATWLGSTIYTTFIAGILMFKNLPRQTFGKLQSKLFPAYFFLNAACISAMLITLAGLRPDSLATEAGYTLGGSLVCTLLNLLYVEPKSTDIMLQRYALENKGELKTDAYAALAGQFGKLHGISSLLNLGALIGAFAYAWKLARVITL